MNLQYVPLLHIQREIQGLPRSYERFQQYLDTVLNADRSDVELVPLLAMNPMGKEHVTELLDRLLVMDADGVARAAAAERPRPSRTFPATTRRRSRWWTT